MENSAQKTDGAKINQTIYLRISVLKYINIINPLKSMSQV